MERGSILKEVRDRSRAWGEEKLQGNQHGCPRGVTLLSSDWTPMIHPSDALGCDADGAVGESAAY